MTGIAAVFRRDGARVDSNSLERLHETLSYRGHDASGLWEDGPVGFGHHALWTTPEAVGERQPIAVDGVWITMDGRLDNRDAFADALPPEIEFESATDAQLLAAGYREYGVDCLDRAIGPLAVALWDGDRERLVCARGKTGIRRLFVAETPDVIVVGSDVATVRAHPAVPERVDESALRAYIAGRAIPADATFDAAIRRLEPGTRLVADTTDVREERYWHPLDPDLDLPSDPEALAAELRDRVRQAVDARLRCREREQPGLLLSGGLDSTAIAGVASADFETRPTLRPYSLVFESIDDEKMTVEERRRLRDVAERHELSLTEIVADDAGPLSDPAMFERPLSNSPCLDPVGPAIRRLHEEMEADGVRVALTGHGGNGLNGTRFAYADLFRRGRVVRLLREVRSDWMLTRELLLWYALVPAVPKLGSVLVDDDGGPDWLLDGTTEESGAGFGGGADRLWSAHRKNVYTEMLSAKRTFKLHAGRQMALDHGTEFRFPYFDPRVVAFAFAAPPIELISGGAKELFLDAFADVLPPSVREIRKGRHFETFVDDGLSRKRSVLRETLTETTLAEQGYVTPGGPREALSAFVDASKRSNPAWRLYAAERWLNGYDNETGSRTRSSWNADEKRGSMEPTNDS